MTEQGCPIESLAKNYSINRVCRQYIEAKQFDSIEGMHEYRNKKFKEYNLDPELILALEPVWLSYKAKIMKERNGNK